MTAFEGVFEVPEPDAPLVFSAVLAGMAIGTSGTTVARQARLVRAGGRREWKAYL